jgi:hypothetical protein
MGWQSSPIETLDEDVSIEIEAARGNVYLEITDDLRDFNPFVLSLSPKQARILRDEINVALYSMDED